MSQKITIEPVTRIEGHARVTIHLNDAGEVEQGYLHVDQFRGFEKFSEGRMFYEMPVITPRICGICPVSHHLAAAKACDKVAGVTPPRPADLLRRLLHKGQLIQSHSMHFFHLASPDLLLGFDADPAVRNVAGLIQMDADLAMKAVKLRKYGQEIIRRLSGRRLHMHWAVPGGVAAPLAQADRDWMLEQVPEMIDYVQDGIAIARSWLEANQDVVQNFANFPSNYMGMVQEDGALELYGGNLRMIDQKGDEIIRFDPCDYLEHIEERVEDWSYLKFPYYKALGWPDGVYRVAPLARLNVATHITTPLANEELKRFKALSEGPVEPSLYYHYARLIEDLYCVERVVELCEDPDILSDEIQDTRFQFTGEGVGCIEAPRGTLWHHYRTDEHGVITKANLIVATGNNNWAMSHAVDMVAKTFVDGNNLTEGMLNRVEAAVRAYDPCLSCSTHALGQMPMIIDIVDSTGQTVKQFRRD
ncbi:MAG TPA: Ni/Fe hydrogenase subunit alpha [Chloroflexi bacterium]|jgi:NAD-reducing hydrogenase large subunit|nr:Ni/Fe hydrogenase subunit alpha [Chloroflexota bacterium]